MLLLQFIENKQVVLKLLTFSLLFNLYIRLGREGVI